MAKEILQSMERLYQELPKVACTQCGLCCVSPTCTLTEFIYFAHHLQTHCSAEQLATYFSMPVEVHPDYAGNIHCHFLDQKRCTMHQGRTGACRLFGIPSLSQLEVGNLEECKENITITKGDGSKEHITNWLDKLASLNAEFYNFNGEPYFVTGFNLPCWFDIYFDDTLDFDVFESIQTVMYDYLDFSSFKNDYALKTDLKDKIDKISILSTLIGSGDVTTLVTTLKSIKEDYPKTGTYYYNEACEFLSVLEKDSPSQSQ